MFRHALLAAALCVTADSAAPGDWRTAAEISGYRRTAGYDDSIAFFRRMAAAYPDKVRLESFGKSGEGRPLYVVMVSKDGVFDPEAVHRSGRAVVLVQNGIHAGEIDGKDASMALLREMVVTRSVAKLLDRAVVLFVAVLNPDGHERSGPYNRINQDGPEEMGWRANGSNLNLNRDYMKLDTPEIRAVVALFTRWSPELVIDNHVTDGADYHHAVNHSIESSPDVHPGIASWVDRTFRPELEVRAGRGTTIARFVTFRNQADLTQGAEVTYFPPRFANGYFVARNRPALLVETHMLKDYRTRVIGNYETMRAALEIVNEHTAILRDVVRQADRATEAGGGQVPLRLDFTGKTAPWVLRGYRAEATPSDVSGTTWVRWTREPVELRVPLATELTPVLQVAVPAAYVVPPQFGDVIDVLEAHGLALRRTTRVWETDAEVYHCAEPTYQAEPYEGRFVLTFGSKPPSDVPIPSAADPSREHPVYVPGCTARPERVTLPAGSAVVPMRQRAAKVAVHFLEPDAPDSAMSWGFFHAIFERKEYAEPYVLEKLAREMLAKDPALKVEFERRLAGDAQFAASPRARLDFFYRRSPWWDARIGVYPVVRLTTLDGAPLSD
jgi:hypothetical protein